MNTQSSPLLSQLRAEWARSLQRPSPVLQGSPAYQDAVRSRQPDPPSTLPCQPTEAVNLNDYSLRTV